MTEDFLHHIWKFGLFNQNNLKTDLLKKSSSQFWKEKIEELGGEYIIWSNAPENPILN